MRREKSYYVLSEVLIKERHAHLVLKELNLKEEDQAFVSALVYTVLQNKLFLEYQFEDLIKRKPKNKVRIVLLMAAAQAFKMSEIPDYALVSEYVELTKKIGEEHASGFVNATLKKMLDRHERKLDMDSLEGISIYYSIPVWILSLLKAQYSYDFALSYAKYIQSIKPTYGWVNTLKTDSIDPSYFDDVEQGIVNTKIFRSEVLDKASVVIQDKNSQDVVNTIPIEKGMDILDCCCAPGTKTLRIANILENTGDIIGVDLIPARVKVTKELMERANVLNTKILEGDAQEISFDKEFDIALIDAPCSGLGVLGHKHDLRYNIQPSDLDDLQTLQANILKNISQYVKKGGLLVYATCTLNKKENEKQIEKFLKENEGYELIYEKTYDPVATQGDGFYVAHCLKKW
ncbi:MAG: methyltransferase domain-containing protein [Erysipelothrix sp.]|nr:methyltransferase domain-containing protein [Erysipelothrix sp.]